MSGEKDNKITVFGFWFRMSFVFLFVFLVDLIVNSYASNLPSQTIWLFVSIWTLLVSAQLFTGERK